MFFSYTKAVAKGMGKAENILKAVMSGLEPEQSKDLKEIKKPKDPKQFVDQVLRLMPEIDKPEFQKILEMTVGKIITLASNSKFLSNLLSVDHLLIIMGDFHRELNEVNSRRY